MLDSDHINGSVTVSGSRSRHVTAAFEDFRTIIADNCFSLTVCELNLFFDRQINLELFDTIASAFTVNSPMLSENVQNDNDLPTVEFAIPTLNTTTFEPSFCFADGIHNTLMSVVDDSFSAHQSPGQPDATTFGITSLL